MIVTEGVFFSSSSLGRDNWQDVGTAHVPELVKS